MFRPCIDLHNGQVKQIVGGSLSDDDASLKTNFVAAHSPAYYADLYKKHNLRGGHIIKLGPGNDDAAREALQAWPDGMHLGGGITSENAQSWLDAGAEKIIVTSYLFPGAKFSLDRLKELCQRVGKERIVVDVSCRKRGDQWIVAMNRWQDLTDMEVNQGMHPEDSQCTELTGLPASLDLLSEYCSEFLIHAADVEGLCQGIDEELVERLGQWVKIPTTYAGGARDASDLETVAKVSNGNVHLTFGSALDIFGGKGVTLDELIGWNQRQANPR